MTAALILEAQPWKLVPGSHRLSLLHDLLEMVSRLLTGSSFPPMQGDGVPPSEAREFCDWLGSPHAPLLPHTSYSVCALGDT